ncbi:MAG: 23S rRNA (uracil(1939)-C(5))-methyltransferase RlmD [Oscillospiraceae bacterium]|jgi:23S rRNA (uracil1939-C5)-methyltransferase|nr:23S rRNA (uracil(1939)-C(5))-methyltransferase RlmD [Oscillospiraceae bacterium]
MAELTKNAIISLCTEGYSSSGDAVARFEGQTVFVKGALAGENVAARILKVTKNVAFAKVESVIDASPHRVVPSCPLFGRCGGCDFLHMDYAEELTAKRQRVEDALRRIGGLDVAVPPVVGAERIARYRNKAIYAVGGTRGEPVTGFYRERSHDILPVDACAIQADYSERAARAVRLWIERRGVEPYDEMTGKGLVRRVYNRFGFGAGQGMTVLVTGAGKLPDVPFLLDALREACPETVSVVRNVNTTRGNTVLAGKFVTLYGEDAIEDELCGLKFRLSPRSFYQVNRDQAERLYARVIALAGLTAQDFALDLYCGVGTITLALAQSAGRVIGAEVVPEAVENARENAKLNGIANAEFILADAAEVAAKLAKSGERPAVVVVDPPRKGLAPEVTESVISIAPERIVYVSCDPATLARDLKLFAEGGYRTVSAEPFDMFPRCAHIETVALLVR